MKAEQARALTKQHSKRIQDIYKRIEVSAKKGNTELWLNSGDATKDELEVLQSNGYLWSYETSETDGGQFLVIKW